ncbi:hypothetical protein B296_00028768, partial [Ensete ventricosum]
CKDESGKLNNRLQTSKANGEAINSCKDDELMEKWKDTLGLVSPDITEKGVAGAELSASPKVQEGWAQASKANSIFVDSSAIESPVVDIPKALADKAPNVKSILPRGLINSGNLCFLNATLQALLSCSLFVKLLQDLRSQSIPEVLIIWNTFNSFLVTFVLEPFEVVAVSLHSRSNSANVHLIKAKAGLVSASKSVKLQKLSKVMILHLMRFSYGSEGSTKLHKPVHFPLELVLGHELMVSPSSEVSFLCMNS